MTIGILADNIPPEGKGGAERVAWETAVALARKGNNVHLITTTQDVLNVRGKTIESVVEGVHVYTIPTNYHVRWRAWRTLYNPKPVREVQQLLERIQPEVIHAHNVHQYLSYSVFHICSRYKATHLKVSILHTIHDLMPVHYGKLSGFIDPAHPVCKKPEEWDYRVSPWEQLKEYRWRYNPVRNFYIKRALRKIDLLTVSKAQVEALRQNGIDGVQVLYNGVDPSAWEIERSKIETFITTHALSGKKTLLFGGRVSGAKGGDALLAALPRVIAALPETMLVIMGTENEYLTKFKKQVARMGLEEHLMYTGWLTGESLKAAYHAATVVVTPTVTFEPLSMVALEAMACEKPVVGSCYGGIAEVIEDGVTGYLVHPLDAETFANKLITLLKDPEKTFQFGNAGRARVERLFSEKRYLENLLRYYDEAMK